MSDPISPPAARRPDELLELVSLALSDGDLEAALAQYEHAAVLRPWADDTRAGGGSLRDTLAQLMALRLPLSAEVQAVLPSGDGLALVRGTREIEGTGPDCEPVRLSGLGTSLVRRQRDGTWRIVAEAWFLAEPAEPGAASPCP